MSTPLGGGTLRGAQVSMTFFSRDSGVGVFASTDGCRARAVPIRRLDDDVLLFRLPSGCSACMKGVYDIEVMVRFADGSLVGRSGCIRVKESAIGKMVKF